MSLKVDSSHEKMNLSGVRLKSKPDIKRTIGAVTLGISILSTSAVRAFDENHESVPVEDEKVTETFSQDDLFKDAPEIVKNYLKWEARYKTVRKNRDNFEQSRNEKISHNEMVDLNGIAFGLEFDDGRTVSSDNLSYEDLLHVVRATIIINDNYDYDFLNYMPNLEELSIFDNSTGEKLTNIQGSVFTKNIKISITGQSGASFSKERYGFIGDIEQIDSLAIGTKEMAMNIDSEFLQSVLPIKHLSLGLDIMTNLHDVDFRGLDSLEFTAKPYDIAMYFSSADLDELEKSGVEVIMENRQEVQHANIIIDKMVRDLNLSEDATDQEKLNAILYYVLDNLGYDYDVSQMVAAGNINVNENAEIREKFYGKGELTAALESYSQICGNYAALVYRLCRAVGLDSFNLMGKNHVWNAVKVGDYYYYVDATWLDDEIVTTEDRKEEETETGKSFSMSFAEHYATEYLKSNDQENLKKFRWYMVDPTETANVDDAAHSHELSYIPAGFEVVAIPDVLSDENVVVEQSGEVPDISESKFKININGKTFIIGGAAFVGIMAGLGIGIVAKRKKRTRIQQTKKSQAPAYNSGPPSYGYMPESPSYDSPLGPFGNTTSQTGDGLFGDSGPYWGSSSGNNPYESNPFGKSPYDDDPFSNSGGFGK